MSTEPADLDTEVLRPDTSRSRSTATRRSPGPDTPTAQHHPLPASGLLRSRSSRPRLLAEAALAAIAAVFTAVDRETGIPATAAAETTAPADGQLPAATAESNYLSTTDDVTALLPTVLLISSSFCRKSGFSSNGALQVQCNLNADSTLGKTIGMEHYEYVSVTERCVDQYTRSNVIRLRDTTDGTTTTVFGDCTRLVDGDSVDTYVRYTVVDRSAGMNATFRMNSVERATRRS